jgi:hypothetical protein
MGMAGVGLACLKAGIYMVFLFSLLFSLVCLAEFIGRFQADMVGGDCHSIL